MKIIYSTPLNLTEYSPSVKDVRKLTVAVPGYVPWLMRVKVTFSYTIVLLDFVYFF
jgi:hypothetical protein